MIRRLCPALCAALFLCAVLAACGEKETFAGSKRPKVESSELQFTTPAEGDPIAVLSTTMGDISIVLYPALAPMAVENFTALAQSGYYNGVPFSRVIEDFMVQTGAAAGTDGTSIWNGSAYRNEITDKLHHYAGAVAMAHAAGSTNGNLSQFYIVQSAEDSVDGTLSKTLGEAGVRESVVNTYKRAGGAPYLDNLNTVFGQVYAGMDVVDAIGAAACDENDRPLEEILVNSVTLGTYSAAAATAPASGAQ